MKRFLCREMSITVCCMLHVVRYNYGNTSDSAVSAHKWVDYNGTQTTATAVMRYKTILTHNAVCTRCRGRSKTVIFNCSERDVNRCLFTGNYKDLSSVKSQSRRKRKWSWLTFFKCRHDTALFYIRRSDKLCWWFYICLFTVSPSTALRFRWTVMPSLTVKPNRYLCDHS